MCGAPSENDWWNETTLMIHSEQNSNLNLAVLKPRSRGESQTKLASRNKNGDDTRNEGETDLDNEGLTKRQRSTFRNCGLLTWEESRKIWRTPPKVAPPQRPPPPPVRYDEIVSGLTQVQRTYELPSRMTLPDIIEVFVDIWECEKDY